MEVKEVEVIKTEKIYKLSESEYKDLINDSRQYGSVKTKDYIIFSYNNFIYKTKSVGRIVEFVIDLMDFITGETDYIRNTYELSFWDWLENNR